MYLTSWAKKKKKGKKAKKNTLRINIEDPSTTRNKEDNQNMGLWPDEQAVGQID